MTVQLVDAFPEARALGEMLRRSHLTVAMAESCTGGLLGAALTAVPGASAYIRGGVIAYADDVKADHLGVSRHLLATHGAVSPPVAEAMAAGARRRYDADLGVGITGVAGPDPGGEGKPAGLVFIAVASAAGVESERLERDAGREANRSTAVHSALRLCRVAAERIAAGEEP